MIKILKVVAITGLTTGKKSELSPKEMPEVPIDVSPDPGWIDQ